MIAALLAFQSNDFFLFRGAALLMTRGYSPYMYAGFFSPIVVLTYYLPFVYLPIEVGFRVTVFVGMLVYLTAIWRACHNWPAFLLAIISPLLLFNAFYANLDWMVFLGVLLLPIAPAASCMLALTKPQIGIIVAALALLELWQGRRYKTIAAAVIFEAAVFGTSIALGMKWNTPIANPWNVSMFPWGLLVGVPLAWYALRHRDRFAGLAAAPLLSPYVGPQSWIAVLPLAARHWWIIAAIDVAAWGVILTMIS